MDTTEPRYHPRHRPTEGLAPRPSAAQDRRRAAWIVALVVAASLAVGAVVQLFAPPQDSYLPESRTATGAEAPAIPVPPAPVR